MWKKARITNYGRSDSGDPLPSLRVGAQALAQHGGGEVDPEFKDQHCESVSSSVAASERCTAHKLYLFVSTTRLARLVVLRRINPGPKGLGSNG